MMSWGLLLSLVPSVIAMKVLDHATYYGFQEYRDRCTAIAAGKLATADGSTITTHNNDCVECDIRITKVPARDWPEGSKRPIQPIRAAYPRYIENPEDSIHGPDYYIDNVDKTIYPWNATEPYYFIDQVKHTYAYTLGAYAIQNEKQVSIGESTCSSIFVATPVFDGGKAVMHLETLTELALERCDTARCAIQLMGDLAVQYGFFGPEWDGNLNAAQDESGEALTVSDPNEAWMFHIMPDDTGASAIWVAQRVPDDHIAVVANQFVIGDIDLTDTNNFLGSSNIYSIAERHHLWSASSGKKLNFMRTFGTNREHMAFGCTRRVWRVMTLAAPSLLPVFSPYTDGMQTFGYGPNLTDPYPFSVKPDKPLTVQDVMNMNRDQYENTEFDMSHNLDAGFFGDTLRYPPTSVLKDPVNGISYQEYEESLGFQRAISLFRTAYSTVTQSRRNLPDAVGAVTWIAPYAPHHSTFVPIYAAAQKAPTSMNVGTQHKFDSRSNWWIHSITGNYLSRWYQHTIGDVQVFQKELETKMFAAQKQMEDHAKQLAEDNASAVIDLITDFQETTAASVRDSWWQFFYRMVGKYRDIYIVENPHAESFSSAFRFMTFSRSWLEIMGFWGVPGTPPHDKTTPMAVKPINVPTYDNMKAYQHAYTPYPAPSVFYQDSTDAVNEGSTSDGGDSSGGKRRHMDPVNTAVPSTMPTNSPSVLSTVKPTTTAEQVISVTSGVFYGSIVAGIVGGIIVGATIMWFVSKRTDYLPLR